MKRSPVHFHDWLSSQVSWLQAFRESHLSKHAAFTWPIIAIMAPQVFLASSLSTKFRLGQARRVGKQGPFGRLRFDPIPRRRAPKTLAPLGPLRWERRPHGCRAWQWALWPWATSRFRRPPPPTNMGTGQNKPTEGVQVLVLGSIFQGSILATYFWTRSHIAPNMGSLEETNLPSTLPELPC